MTNTAQNYGCKKYTFWDSKDHSRYLLPNVRRLITCLLRDVKLFCQNIFTKTIFVLITERVPVDSAGAHLRVVVHLESVEHLEAVVHLELVTLTPALVLDIFSLMYTHLVIFHSPQLPTLLWSSFVWRTLSIYLLFTRLEILGKLVQITIWGSNKLSEREFIVNGP